MTVEQIIEAIRTCSRGEKPRYDISDILHSHRCYALIEKSKDPMELVKQAANRVAIKERYAACERFFETAKFPYAVIKGAILSNSVYGDSTLRISGDIDILINRRDVDDAKRILKECGFIQGRISGDTIVPFTRKELLYQSAMSHQTAPFIKATANKLCPYVNLDINMDILWGESEQKSDMDIVLSHREQVSIFGMNIYKLTSDMEFIALCLHHYKDMNSIYLLSGHGLRLGLFCDIYFYIKNVCPSAVTISRLAGQLNVGKYLYVCLSHTMEIFDDSILSPYIKTLEEYKDEELLNGFGLNDKERKYWDIPLAQRLFHNNLPEYMQKFLSDSDVEKIRINRENM